MSCATIQCTETPTCLVQAPVVIVSNPRYLPVGSQFLTQLLATPNPNYACGPNNGPVPFVLGNVIGRYPTGTGFVLANASSLGGAAIGLAVQVTGPTGLALVQLGGQLVLSDWSSITGTVQLTPGGIYFLDTNSGRLTLTSPAAGISQLIGYAISPMSLDITLQPPILL